MQLQRRAFISSVSAMLAAEALIGQQREPGKPAAPQAGVPGAALFGGLCLFAVSKTAGESHVILPRAETAEIGRHVPVMQIPLFAFREASPAMRKRIVKKVSGHEVDISYLEVLLPGRSEATGVHRPPVGECPSSPSEWNSMEWVAHLNKIAPEIKLHPDWRRRAHSAVRLAGGLLVALPPGKRTEGIWRWRSSGGTGQSQEIRQAVTDSVLYGYQSAGRIHFASIDGKKLEDHWLDLRVPLMSFTHVAAEKGETRGVSHLHLLNDLLSKALNNIVPERVGKCVAPNPAEAVEASTENGAKLLQMDVEREAWRAAALGALFHLYYDVYLDDYKDCPGMAIDA